MDPSNWRKIMGFVNYEISEEGEIVSFWKNKTTKINISIRNNNYYVLLWDGKVNVTRKVVKLMAETWVDNPFGHKHIIFKDSDKLNIHKDNLIWSDNPYNSNDKWEIIEDYPIYEISINAVRNKNSKRSLEFFTQDGYPKVNLYDNNNKKCKKVFMHILIAKQYIPNPNNLPQVNHKNGIKIDFSIENLEWVTGQQNQKHASETGLRKTNNKKGRKIELLNDNLDVVKTFISVLKASEFIGYSDDTIRVRLMENKYYNNTAIINNYIIRYKVDEELNGEVWKNVNTIHDEVNNKYEVSSFGRIRNISNKQILSPSIRDSYYVIGLNGKYNSKTQRYNGKLNCRVNRLVAFAFLDFKEEERDYDVNHKDKNSLNNNLINLEILHRKEHTRKDHGKCVIGVSESSKYIIFRSVIEAAESVEVCSKSIIYAIQTKGIYREHKWYYYNSVDTKNILKTCKQNLLFKRQLDIKNMAANVVNLASSEDGDKNEYDNQIDIKTNKDMKKIVSNENPLIKKDYIITKPFPGKSTRAKRIL